MRDRDDPRHPANRLPPGLRPSEVVLWGAAIEDHPITYHPWFSWMAVGERGVARMATALSELMDQRERILGAAEADRWRVTLDKPAMVWWPTVGALARHPGLRQRIETHGARLGVYLHPFCLKRSPTLPLPVVR